MASPMMTGVLPAQVEPELTPDGRPRIRNLNPNMYFIENCVSPAAKYKDSAGNKLHRGLDLFHCGVAFACMGGMWMAKHTTTTTIAGHFFSVGNYLYACYLRSTEGPTHAANRMELQGFTVQFSVALWRSTYYQKPRSFATFSTVYSCLFGCYHLYRHYFGDTEKSVIHDDWHSKYSVEHGRIKTMLDAADMRYTEGMKRAMDPVNYNRKMEQEKEQHEAEVEAANARALELIQKMEAKVGGHVDDREA